MYKPQEQSAIASTEKIERRPKATPWPPQRNPQPKEVERVLFGAFSPFH
jgi:hypothetical protein